MSTFWKNWLTIWCFAVCLFGAILAGGAFAATDGIAYTLFEIFGQQGPLSEEAPMRFMVGLVGAVTLGWGLTMFVAFQAAHLLEENGRPLWRHMTVFFLIWYVVDSTISIATGFWPNAVSNTVFLAGYLIPVFATGALGSGAHAKPA